MFGGRLIAVDFLNGKIKTMYYKYLAAAFFSIFWTALSLAVPNVYVRIFMSPTAEILRIAPGINLLPAVAGPDSIWFAMVFTEAVIAVYVIWKMAGYTKKLAQTGR